MIDWEGLLKFTLKYTDGTKKTDFKEMSSENKKWLEEAMQHYTNSQVQRIKQILKHLDQYQKLTDEQQEGLLEEMQELLDSLDGGKIVYKMGGHITLMKIIFYGKCVNARILAMQIYCSCNQNDAFVQNTSINTGALEMVELIKKEENLKIRQNLISAISATLRGENLEAKRIFIKLKGFDLLNKLAHSQDASPKIIKKINTLWRDLLYYDDNLFKTYNDLSAFNNTSNITIDKQKQKQNEKKHNLSYDVNQQFKDKNQLPENKQFKGSVKKYMNQNPQLQKEYLEWLQQQIKGQK